MSFKYNLKYSDEKISLLVFNSLNMIYLCLFFIHKKILMKDKEKINLLINHYLKITSSKGSSLPKGLWGNLLKYRIPGYWRDTPIALYRGMINHYKSRMKSKKNDHQSSTPSVEQLAVKRYNGKKIDKDTISKYLKELVFGIDKAMAMDYVVKTPRLSKYLCLKWLRELNNTRDILFDKMVEFVNECKKTKTPTIHYEDYLMKRDLFFHPHYESKSPSGIDFLSEIIKEHRVLSALETLKLELQVIQLNKGGEIPVEGIPGTRELIYHLKNEGYLGHPSIELYSLLILYETETPAVDILLRIVKKFKLFIDDFTAYDAPYLYNLISNSLTRLGRSGNTECLAESVKLDDFCVRTNAIMVDGKIPYGHFINIILKRCDLMMKEGGKHSYRILIDYINKWLDHVSSYTEDAENLVKKYVHFKFGKYKQAYDMAMKPKPILVDKILHYSLHLGCLYELSDDIKYRQWFQNNSLKYEKELDENKEGLSAFQLDGYRRFHKIIKRFFALKEQIMDADMVNDKWDLIDQFEVLQNEMDDGYVPFKDWLKDRKRMPEIRK